MSLLLFNFVEQLPLIICIVILAAMVVIYFFRKKKYNDQMESMQNSLKKGDTIVTYSGIVGDIVESTTDKTGKYFVIKTGIGEHAGFIKVDSRSIYGPVSALQPQASAKVEPKKVDEKKETIQKSTATTKANPVQTKKSK